MILFLHKVRQKVLSNKRFTTYIVYAIGEIILVVIGILIAVYFNNLNTQNKLDEKERLSLQRLKEDLKNDMDRYDFLKSDLEMRFNRCDSVQKVFQSDLSQEEKISTISVPLIFFYLVEANTTTYNEMINTGRLYAMNDKNLRSQIIKYYSNVTKWGKYIEKQNQQVRRLMVHPVYNDLWTIQDKVINNSTIEMEKYDWLNDSYSKKMKDIEALVVRAKKMYRSNFSEISFLKERCNYLLELLEKKGY